ncbi:hypothetical protein BTS2_2711 [Bacillus sp. TS-2]|nr:hypothetical protein BTS2_2711 [Bacillus sp. TS-2]
MYIRTINKPPIYSHNHWFSYRINSYYVKPKCLRLCKIEKMVQPLAIPLRIQKAFYVILLI